MIHNVYIYILHTFLSVCQYLVITYYIYILHNIYLTYTCHMESTLIFRSLFRFEGLYKLQLSGMREKCGRRHTQYRIHVRIWLIFKVVVSNMFYFHPYLGKIPILTNIFPKGPNHQMVFMVNAGKNTIHGPFGYSFDDHLGYFQDDCGQ